MGLFDGLFGKKTKTDSPFLADAAPDDRDGNLGVLIPFNGDIEVTDATITKHMKRLDAPSVPISVQTMSSCGRLDIDGELVDFIVLDAPVPESVVDHLCQVTHWRDADKAVLRKHKSHYIAWYAGDSDPTTAYVTLMKAAWALAGTQMTGVVLESAVNFLPPSMVQQMLSAEMLPSLYESVPVGILTGLLKFFSEDGTWVATRGHEVFGVPNFAMWVAPPLQPSDAMDLFGPLFNYAYSAKVHLGHDETMELGGQNYRLDPVTEYKEYVAAPEGETLVLTPIG